MIRTLSLLTMGFLLATSWIMAQPVVSRPSPQHSTQDDPGVILPVGTRIQVILNNYLGTENSQSGDTFYAIVDFPVFSGSSVAIPADSLVKGSVVEVQRAGRIRGRSSIVLDFEQLLLINGVTRDFDAEIFSINDAGEYSLEQRGARVVGTSSEGRDASIVVGTGTQGAIIGAIAGEGKGLAIGAAAGAAAGLSILLVNRGRDVTLDRGLSLELILLRPLEFTAGEMDFSNAPVYPERRMQARDHFRPGDREKRRYHRSHPWPIWVRGVFHRW